MSACWRLIDCRYPSTLTFRSGESMYSSRRFLSGINIITFVPGLITYAKELFSNLSSIGLKAIPAEHIIANVVRRTAPG